MHLDLVLEDETVVQAVPSIGYIHRGLEKLVDKRDFKQYSYIAERICGICSCGHGLGLLYGCEEVMGVEVPERANYLRAIWVEMSRIHSHLLWLGLLADAMGFESLSWRAGGCVRRSSTCLTKQPAARIIHSVNQVGGVQKDMDHMMLHHLLEAVKDIESDIKPVVDTFLQDYTVQSRLKGAGVLKKEDAVALGAVGPMLRASGVEYDVRMLGYGAYKDLTVKPITSTDGDCYGRCEVRLEGTVPVL